MRKGTSSPNAGVSASRGFYGELLLILRNLYTDDGQLKEKPAGPTLKRLETDAPEQFGLLREIIRYALESNYFSKEVLDWLLEYYYMSQAKYAEWVGININTFGVHLRREKKKFMADFGERCLKDLTEPKTSMGKQVWLSPEELAHYRGRLNAKKNTIAKLQEHLTIDLSSYASDMVTEIDSDDFEQMCKRLWNLASKSRQKQQIDSLRGEGIFGYINYLLQKHDKTEKELQDYALIIKMMNGIEPVRYMITVE